MGESERASETVKVCERARDGRWRSGARGCHRCSQNQDPARQREQEGKRVGEREKERDRERESTHERTSVSVSVSESETASEVVTGVPEIKTLYETERAIVS